MKRKGVRKKLGLVNREWGKKEAKVFYFILSDILRFILEIAGRIKNKIL